MYSIADVLESEYEVFEFFLVHFKGDRRVIAGVFKADLNGANRFVQFSQLIAAFSYLRLIFETTYRIDLAFIYE